jgi:hypothetical protein
MKTEKLARRAVVGRIAIEGVSEALGLNADTSGEYAAGTLEPANLAKSASTGNLSIDGTAGREGAGIPN